MSKAKNLVKVGQDIDTCSQRIEDGHCFNCSLYQDVSDSFEISEETKAKGLKALVEAANVALSLLRHVMV
jgi:hypothetical protein